MSSRLEDIFNDDFEYLKWLEHERPPWEPFTEVDFDCIDPDDYVMPFGKYQHLTVSYIKKIDPKYFGWMIKTEYKNERLTRAINKFK